MRRLHAFRATVARMLRRRPTPIPASPAEPIPESVASVVMTGTIADLLHSHLARRDEQEDICFALYRTSTGARRTTAILVDVLLPEAGEREVHGNASFHGRYFLRACAVA